MSKFILTIHIDLQDARADEEVVAFATQMEEQFDAAEIGRFVGSGGGMNQIDLTYLVQNAEVAKVKMEETLETLGLRATHHFISEEFTGDEATYFDEVEALSLTKLSYFFGLILFLFLSLIYVAWVAIGEMRR